MAAVIRALRRRLLALAARVAIACASRLPRSLALAIGSAAGSAAHPLLRRYRKLAERQLEEALGAELDRRARRRAVRAMFRHFGSTAFDTAVMCRWGAERIRREIPIEGWTEAARLYDSVLAEGKGLIALTGHLGNWELVACLGASEWPGRVECIARRYEFAGYNRIVERIRERFGAKVIYQDDSARVAIRVLRRNGLLGILPDQDLKRIAGLFVDFFGRPAYTPSAPANFCLRFGSPIVPLFIVRAGRGYKVITAKPIRAEDAAGYADPIAELTRRWSAALESTIRLFPEQWVWMHRRWHTTPEILARRALVAQGGAAAGSEA
ncbi:MAG: lysophospholipid acyltransferase family protein [Planctomycetes bacterium]|nr:lysophospholipid acyltransferase family protein [Planctomycetota bacterium]